MPLKSPIQLGGVYTSEETLISLLVTTHRLYNLMEGPQEPCELREYSELSPYDHKGMLQPGGNGHTIYKDQPCRIRGHANHNSITVVKTLLPKAVTYTSPEN